ncbi:carbohydrate ABC transporter substrate-binding protein, CUT1 family [Palleronia marisminoris]|uniref:Putative ABC transporter-binding protein n=1 Tax=Palleronia marisminoris TaxID=315423 RepID=A0A1Y5S1K2_9RHOB|nr:sugar ABC transporter substrate-binding protein [Palleronia marisminoris]SFG39236.1 carbohydrate ABC transporter substrate-binding protein, CUT1 family [Palleronia marisminoris]SLN29547.1 putative ABC transporter-binding protein precursor [Palleronia marisminoris]
MKRLTCATALALLAAGGTQAADLTLVEVITSPERTETLESLTSAWEEETGNTVEIVSLPWGQAFEKFATMVAGGDIPDVVEMPDRWLALYGQRLMDLAPHVEGWEHADTLTQATTDMGSATSDGSLKEIPYGFYLRAMFYNKDLLEEAGIDGPPETMEEFREAAAAVSELDGKSGYCLRGGPGGLNAWMMMAAAMRGDSAFFDENGQSTINSPEAVEGLQFLIDMYQDGLAPRDSVSWGFNEIVAGFYSGTCAFLDQDPDALIAVSERMDADSFAVAPMPKGPDGKAFPTIGYAGWAAFDSTEHPDEAWSLIAHLSKPESNETWAKRVGVIPIHEGADRDPYYQSEQFKGWFTELNDPAYEPITMPAYLEQFGYFADSIALETSQQALLGEITAQEMADQWAEFLTEQYAAWQENQ